MFNAAIQYEYCFVTATGQPAHDDVVITNSIDRFPINQSSTTCFVRHDGGKRYIYFCDTEFAFVSIFMARG